MPTISSSALFLVSGGARGITAECVIEMARHFHCKFILLGRTAIGDEPVWALGAEGMDALKKRAIADMQAQGEKPTPAIIGKRVNGVLAGREIRHTLERVKQAGGDAVYLSADITDMDALRAALDTFEGMGVITGILHGAGNLADKLIENKTEADFETVYSAKVEGLQNLLAIVDAERLETLVLFSSVAGFYGNIGQADYAIANEILNKTAYAFKGAHPRCHVVSINWGPWDGGMVTPQLRAYFDQLDIRVIPVAVGARMLVDELRSYSNTANSSDANGESKLSLMPVQIIIGSAIRPQPAPADETLRTHRLRRTLRLADSPFLADHVVNAQAVLPMVSAMSWMATACEGVYRGYRYFGYENYRVLKGIVFDSTLADGYILELKEMSKSADTITVDATVRSETADGKPRFHYSARLFLRTQIPEAPMLDLESRVVDDGIPGTQLYADGTLFHGYSFQGIDRVLSIDDRGLMMRCVLPQISTDYQGQFPVQAFNYFMVDIGLQSIGIWARKRRDMGSLPLRSGGGTFYDNVDFGETFYVTMEIGSVTDTNVTANITLHDENGRIYAIIDTLEVTMSERLKALFLKNRLPETVP